jgi:hypothetical protein
MQTEHSLCQRRAHDIQTDLRPILVSNPRATTVPAAAAIAKTFPAVFSHNNCVFEFDIAPLRVWQRCFDGEDHASFEWPVNIFAGTWHRSTARQAWGFMGDQAHAMGHKMGDGFVGQAVKRFGTGLIDVGWTGGCIPSRIDPRHRKRLWLSIVIVNQIERADGRLTVGLKR